MTQKCMKKNCTELAGENPLKLCEPHVQDFAEMCVAAESRKSRVDSEELTLIQLFLFCEKRWCKKCWNSQLDRNQKSEFCKGCQKLVST